MIRVRRMHWLLVLLVAAPLAVYLPSVARNAFVTIDDGLLITNNAAVQSITPRTVAYIFTSYDPELYIPLTLLTYQIEWAIAGATPALFHLTNLLLHIGSGILFFLLLRRITGGDGIAIIGALLFLLHPVHTEAVMWAAARKDVLSTFFFLLSLLLYEYSAVESEDSPTGLRKRILSIASFLLALLAKVTVLPLPLVLLLLDWRRGERITLRRLARKWPYFLLSAVFLVIAALGKTRNITELTVLQYALIAAKSTVFYLGKMFWPVDLSVAYSQTTPVILGSPEFLVPMILTVFILAATLALPRIHRGVAFGMLFFILTLPVNFFNVWKNEHLFFASDRYVYIPSLGIIMAIVALLGLAASGRSRRTAAAVAAPVVIAVLAVLTVAQAATWRDSETLYVQGLSAYPSSPLLLVNLGDVYVRSGREREGLEQFEKAIAIAPHSIVALTNAGNLYKKWGDRAQARALYARAVEAVTEDPLVEHLLGYYLLAEMQLEDGKEAEGFALLTEATRRGSRFAEPFYNLGIMLQRYGRTEQALAAFSDAVAADGTYIAARYHLAGLYAERGRLAEARDQLEYVVSVDPGYEKAAEHLQAIRRLLQK